MRASSVEKALIGQTLSADTIAQGSVTGHVTISAARSSATCSHRPGYRKAVAPVWVKRALAARPPTARRDAVLHRRAPALLATPALRRGPQASPRAPSTRAESCSGRCSSRAKRASARPKSPRCWPRRFETELIRLQCYEGLDISARRLRVELRAAAAGNPPDGGLGHRGSPEGGAASCSARTFCIERPLLQALSSRWQRPPVLLIDELDRADEEFEGYSAGAAGRFPDHDSRAGHDSRRPRRRS